MKWKGKGVSEGLAMAELCLYAPQLPEIPRMRAQDPEQELRRFSETMDAARRELRELYENAQKKLGTQEAAIFDAHLTMLEDEYSVTGPITASICEQGSSAAAAISDQFDALADMLRALDDELLSQRAADMEDLKRLLLRICLNVGCQTLEQLDRDVILLADELTPSDTVRMDIRHVKGIATRLGSGTSHSAIIARTLGIPAVSGLDGWKDCVHSGQKAILDADAGTLLTEPTAQEEEDYRIRRAQVEQTQQRLLRYRTMPSRTADGVELELCANIGLPHEAQQAMQYGADGVGLLRSEFLFMDRETLPTEEEQYLAYRQAAEALNGRPLIIRTLDVGGDKKLPALALAKEENPFLGFRAIRMTLARPEIFRPQLRAIIRAAACGNVSVMFPMISTIEQLRQAKTLLREESEALRAAGVPTGAVRVGMMVEIPAAALLAEQFAQEVDFFSIGTNDLTQYSLAVERGNEAVCTLYTPEHPAVLRLIAMTARAAHERGIPCGMCGEAAGDPDLMAAFVGMGVRELSMSPAHIPAARKLLSERTMEQCRMEAQKLLQK